MKFIELIKQVDINEVIDYLVTEKDELASSRDGYLSVYFRLLELPVEETTYKIYLVNQKGYSDENDDYIDVLGYDTEDGVSYSLSFTSWSCWLGSEVVEKSLNSFGAVVFVANCLYDMTFMGFSEENIQNELDILKDRVKEVEEGTATYYTFEEVVARLNESTGMNYEIKERTEEEDRLRKEEFQRINDYNEEQVKNILS